MRTIFIEQNDHELFMTDVDHNLYGFFLDHVDTFRRMWEEQGKTFWVRFLISFRDYVYNKGHGLTFIQDVSLKFCVHKLSLVGDGVFLNIHKHFVDGRINKAREFIGDVACLTRNKHLLQHLGKKSIVNNPFYLKEVRDSFRKLLWYPQSRSMTNQDVVVFQIAFASPIYAKFGGAISILLKRWISSKVNSVDVSPDYWSPPSHWANADYVPTPFEYCLAEHWNAKLDEMTGLKGFYKQLQKKKSEFEESKPCGKTACRKTEEKAASSARETFVDFCSTQFKNEASEFSSEFRCKLKDLSSGEGCFLDPDMVDRILDKVFKERKILEMAESQFEDEKKTLEKKQRNRQKKRNAIRNAFEQAAAGKDQNKAEPLPQTSGSETVQNGKDSVASSRSMSSQTESNNPLKNNSKQSATKKNKGAGDVPKKDENTSKPGVDNKIKLPAKEVASKTVKEKGVDTVAKNKSVKAEKRQIGRIDSELREIKENIDKITSGVEKEGGLEYDNFLLMLKTGELLTRNSKPASSEGNMAKETASLHVCSHCAKKEVDPKTFKKCSRCKVENIENPRYYCSRDCQIDDWEECHRKEHSLFQKK